MVFAFPIDTSKLQNDKLRLVPFEDNLPYYIDEYMANVKDHPHLHKYTGYGPFSTVDQYTKWYEGRVLHNQADIVFAIVLAAKTTITRRSSGGGTGAAEEEFTADEGTMAGTIGLTAAKRAHSSAEVAHILLFPRFQRTFVGTAANALLLSYLLDGPGSGGDGLHLRRVEWQANVENQASINAAKRLGFKFEGVARWQLVLRDDKEGMTPEGLPTTDCEGRSLGPGRHSAMLALCWDDWLEYGRERVQGLLRK